MPAFVYVISDGTQHLVLATDGELSTAIAEHDKALGKPAMLLWAEGVRDIETANRLVPLIEKLDDTRYAALLAGEDEAMSLLREGAVEGNDDDLKDDEPEVGAA